MFGGAGNDSIDGGAGHDLLVGQMDDDTLNGGAGLDTLWGGEGDDSLNGGDDDDMLHADEDDTVDGGNGIDTLSLAGQARSFSDQISLGSGSAPVQNVEDFIGSEDDDNVTSTFAGTANRGSMIEGRGGDDTLAGGSGDDIIDGGAGDDTIDGGTGADKLNGGAGMDTVVGGAGEDTIDGGDDDVVDMLTGGDGNDTFVWRDGDTIRDFHASQDMIDLEPGVNRDDVAITPIAAADLPTGLPADSAGFTVTIGGEMMTVFGLAANLYVDATADPLVRTFTDDDFIFG